MDSFEETADWCERYLEGKHGREVGMTFGAALRALERLRGAEHLPAQAVRLRSARASRYILVRGSRDLGRPRLDTMVTNMIYDSSGH